MVLALDPIWATASVEAVLDLAGVEVGVDRIMARLEAVGVVVVQDTIMAASGVQEAREALVVVALEATAEGLVVEGPVDGKRVAFS